MPKPIYLDYAATTPVLPEVVEVMQQYLGVEGDFGNAASLHYYGAAAASHIEQAREVIARCINAAPSGIIFTSGATEANNLAIKGLAYAYQHKGSHIITSKAEHKSVLEPCRFLESQGFQVTYLPVDTNGLVNLEELKAAIRPDTILISLIHVNNEIGSIQDLAAIGNIAHQHDIVFHSDAAQSIGKAEIDVKAMQVDALSLSAHKAYGPKGIGVLYLQRPKIRLQAQLHGGGHENQLRSGTLATHQILGMAKAYELTHAGFMDENNRMWQLKNRFLQGIKGISAISVNGDPLQNTPYIINLSFSNLNGEVLNSLFQTRFAIASGAACDSNRPEPSHVLRAIGLSPDLAESSVRISFGKYTSEQDIDFIVNFIKSGILHNNNS
jgi:cysteine desulfurase